MSFSTSDDDVPKIISFDFKETQKSLNSANNIQTYFGEHSIFDLKKDNNSKRMGIFYAYKREQWIVNPMNWHIHLLIDIKTQQFRNEFSSSIHCGCEAGRRNGTWREELYQDPERLRMPLRTCESDIWYSRIRKITARRSLLSIYNTWKIKVQWYSLYRVPNLLRKHLTVKYLNS